MKKKGVAKWLRVLLIILLVVAILLAILVLILLVLKISAPEGVETADTKPSILENPIRNLTDQQAQEKLNETFVTYLLYTIGADKLHEPPLSSNAPEMNLFIDELDFGAQIRQGMITVTDEPVDTEDIIIRTTRAEAVKMLRDKEYITTSFNTGASQIELVASKTELFTKGYLSLYTELTGEEASVEE